ncbi:MAG: 1,2-dihydroxy-3-keto-5-methylthiopentene dioxygenase [Gammaproteobacteria bacterium]
MSALTIYPDDKPQLGSTSKDFDAIAEHLKSIGVQFERWEPGSEFIAEAEVQTVVDAYQTHIDRLMEQFGFKSVDVVSLAPDHPDKQALRQKFLSEHTHSDFEVRFFVEGSGLFFLHVADKVYAILCEQGDLISVPAHTKHWFDMGEKPEFKCIRLFTTEDGWIAEYTGDKIADKFPTFDQYVTGL